MSPTTRFTPDDVLALEDEGLFELVDGKLLEKSMGYLSNQTAGLVAFAIQSFIHSGSTGGVILPEQSFQCFPLDSQKVRRPDIAFITAARIPRELPTGHVPIAPDIAIEIVSPSDKLYEVDEKLDDYRSAGVKLVWVVNPNSRTIRIYRPDHTVTELQESDTLVGENVLPGFAVPVRELLPPNAAAVSS